MSSLVSDFLINPVLRQARRFSEISRATFAGDGDKPTVHTDDNAVSNSSHIDNPVPDSTIPVESPLPRPLSASTQEIRVRVEEPALRPAMADAPPTRDHISLALSPRSPRKIPEDDGMKELRTRIHGINARDIPSEEKAKMIHDTLLEGYRASKTDVHIAKVLESDGSLESALAQSPTSSPLKFWQNQSGEPLDAERFILSDEDIKPTYVPVKQPKHHGSETPVMPSEVIPETDQPLGCQHYERNVKLQCFTCKKWYTCRFCHDANEDHNLVRRETRNMLCMICATPQKASNACIGCGEIAAHYYCNICKLWENRQSKSIYHCNDCGICRRGMGLGKDFFHCKTCRACISTSIETSHKCIERSTDCDCPICGEYMFTSPRPVVFMPCGHSIHRRCYEQHMKVSYKCPICNKSLTNMESQFRNLDVAIQSQPMPPEFRNTTAVILCNDCSGKSTVRYHWLGLKCSICRSYNTVEMNIHGRDSGQAQPSLTEEGELPADAEASRQAPASASGNRVAAVAVNRRRHSSHGVEAQYRAPDRVARSVSPIFGLEAISAHLALDDESDNDILRLWRGRGLNDETSTSDEESESDDDTDGPSDAEDDDDDDDNEIMLIGHR
ncbi:hypothetical protein BGZ61DRAFT_348676 [Ilyonectria robusta]|uniref:uncharacterized protein n=1 Tax=Ilyonectria robusta TaxID=1079257 RepID=UPI001E8E3C0B|nr:uncharacterized protein BGZ61DRAFT_348676 [Ilyonectria robusta]KAH8714244.1 hypothetical protein BGZ61DRAFT_348676 [Ilyonectria robusta]